MSQRTKLVAISTAVVASVSIIIAVVTIFTLYKVSLEQRGLALVHTVQSQARLMEVVAKVDLESNGNDSSKATPITLKQFVDAHQHFPGIGETGEFTLAKREGDQIIFLLSHRHADLENPQPIAWDSELAEPMRRALSEQSGTVVGLDYRGEIVVAAHEPVAGLNWGIVAKIDLAEIRAPFVRAGMITGAVSILIACVGVVILFYVTRPVIDRLEQVEQAVRASEKQFRLAVESSPSAMVMINQLGNIQMVNAETERLFGFGRADLLGHPIEILIPERYRNAHPSLRGGFFAEPEPRRMGAGRDLFGLRNDGSEFPIEIGLNPLETDDGLCVLSSIVDITERKDAKEQLVQARDELERRVEERTAELETSILALSTSEERVRVLLDSTAEAIYGVDLNGDCTFANPACVRLLGYQTVADLLGQNMHTLIHHTRDDGTAHPVEACLIFEAVQQGEGTHADDEVLWRADGTSFPVEYWSYPIRQQDRTIGAVVTFLDITERRQAEAAMRHERDFADAVINALPGVFYVFDEERGLLRWNKNVEKIIGYTGDELANMTPLQFFRETDHALVAEGVKRAFEEGSSTTLADYLFKDGRSAAYLSTGIRFESDGRLLLLGIGTDVSEQQAAEAQLRDHTKRLEVIGNIMESVLDAQSTEEIARAVLKRLNELVPCQRSSVVLFDDDLGSATLLAAHGATTSMQPGMKLPVEMFGGSELLQQGLPHRINDLGSQVDRSTAQQTLFDEGVRSYASVPLRVEGDLVGTLNIAADQPDVFSDDDLTVAGEVARPLAVCIRQSQLHEQVRHHADDLEQRVTERTAELMEAEERFGLVVEAMPTAVVMIDAEGVIRLVNAQVESLFGYSRPELVGQAVEMLVPEPHRADHPAMRTGYVANPEARAMGASRDLTGLCKDGRAVPVEIGLNPLTIDGQIFVLASVVDITERALAEDALRQSEERFRELFENANDLIQAVSPDGRFIYVNPAWCRTLGYEADEIESLTMFDVIHPQSRDHCMQLFQQIMSGETVDSIEATFQAKNGSRVLVEGQAGCQFDSDGKPVVTRGIFRDVTARTQAEAVLREEFVLGQLRFDIHIALSNLGSVQDVLQICCQAVVDHLDAAFARVWTLDEADSMLELQASAGLYTHLDGSHGRVPVGKFKIGLIAEERQPHLTNSVIGDPRVSDQDWAREEGMVAFAGYPLVADDRVIGVLAMFARHELTDITLRALGSISQGVALGIERIRAEEELRTALEVLAARSAQLEVAKEQAEAADRVKSAFLATMSHELRTPLNSIIGFTGTILKGFAGPVSDEQHKQLGMVQRSGRHLLSLINDVLDISKIEAGQFEVASEPFNLRETIEKAVATVSPAAEQKNLALHIHTDPAIGEFVGDQRRVQQVLLNLMSNAVKFTETGEVRVTSELTAEAIVMRVTDTGCGVKPEDMSRLFEAFVQLDSTIARQHEGTGLGLAICKRVVNLMGGDILVESTWNKGTTFSFTLPLHTAAGGSEEARN